MTAIIKLLKYFKKLEDENVIMVIIITRLHFIILSKIDIKN